MVEKKQITLIYSYNDNWIGGTYYILNIIKSLKFLGENDQPRILVVCDIGTDRTEILKIGYKFIDFLEFSFEFNIGERIINKIGRLILGKLLVKKKIPIKDVKNLYPVSDFISTTNVTGFYYWIPDFQEHYLPQFFSKGDLASRFKAQNSLVKGKYPIVFSSQNAYDDYEKFYPHNQNEKKVLRFVSILGAKYLDINIDVVLEKFKLKKPYFIVPNQFWRHKNHIVILKAVKLLAQKRKDFHVVFTGKEHDFRHPEHVPELKQFIKDNNLEDRFSFLGFIDRNEQLCLMKHSISIIQPSLFEGWSTVVEDTKAINHFIVLSDINLHREQINQNCLFFDPYSDQALADKMEEVLRGVNIVENNYSDEIMKSGLKFISLFN
ncbi:glycosyltransferase [Pedobacter jejuensis]|uniref:Glycosyltransferase n=1 Tax=Pedobacter jejuensis TaxID=1268550 RepID=A0A3N0C331_9SPHI|nr:glycosyltransferase [Pedobacter jejuensis]RNL56905.1 glycosyltransferase [Pedobacter jejuensis]